MQTESYKLFKRQLKRDMESRNISMYGGSKELESLAKAVLDEISKNPDNAKTAIGIRKKWTDIRFTDDTRRAGRNYLKAFKELGNAHNGSYKDFIESLREDMRRLRIAGGSPAAFRVCAHGVLKEIATNYEHFSVPEKDALPLLNGPLMGRRR